MNRCWHAVHIRNFTLAIYGVLSLFVITMAAAQLAEEKRHLDPTWAAAPVQGFASSLEQIPGALLIPSNDPPPVVELSSTTRGPDSSKPRGRDLGERPPFGSLVVVDSLTGQIRDHIAITDPVGRLSKVLLEYEEPPPSYGTALPAHDATDPAPYMRLSLLRQSVALPDGRFAHLLHVLSQRVAKPIIDTANGDPAIVAQIENDLTYEVEQPSWVAEQAGRDQFANRDYVAVDRRIDSLLLITGSLDSLAIESVRGFGTDRVVRAITVDEAGQLRIAWNNHDRQTVWLGPAWQRVYRETGYAPERLTTHAQARTIEFGTSILDPTTFDESDSVRWTETDVQQTVQRRNGEQATPHPPVVRLDEELVLLQLRTTDCDDPQTPDERRLIVRGRNDAGAMVVRTSFLDVQRSHLAFDIDPSAETLLVARNGRLLLYPLNGTAATTPLELTGENAPICICEMPTEKAFATRTPDGKAIIVLSDRFTVTARTGRVAEEVRLLLLERLGDADWTDPLVPGETVRSRSEAVYQETHLQGEFAEAAMQIQSLFGAAPKRKYSFFLSPKHHAVTFLADAPNRFVVSSLGMINIEANKRTTLHQFDLDTIQDLPIEHGHVNPVLPMDVTFGDCNP